MDGGLTGRLLGPEIHGFRTLQDLDVGNIMEEAITRWLRPNEIYAILRNHHYFSISVKPVNLPKSGAIILFDRKKLRNFRKDGHNWKKKKDGKTVKEAHEHLKVGNEERIHVYYAHGQDKPTFVRRIYWLLDKMLEHIVLVHYRETQEGSPATPVISSPNLSEEIDSGGGNASSAEMEEILEPYDSLGIKNHERRLHEINTLDWDDLVTNDPNNLTPPGQDRVSGLDQSNQAATNCSIDNRYPFSLGNQSTEVSPFGTVTEAIAQSNNINHKFPDDVCIQTLGDQVTSEVQGRESFAVCSADSSDIMVNDSLSTQDSFGRWMDSIIADSPGSIDNTIVESSVLSNHVSSCRPLMENHQTSDAGITFEVSDVSPAWAFSTEVTKILIAGVLHEKCHHLAKSSIFCVCGNVCTPAEMVKEGVYRCMVLPHAPGIVNLFLSFDGHTPISQVLTFEYRATSSHVPVILSEDNCLWEAFQVQMRLTHLLFSTTKCLDIASSKLSSAALKEAKDFLFKASNNSCSWPAMTKSIEDNGTSLSQAKDILFEHALSKKLIEWLLERITIGCKTTEYDAKGQGVIHLCAILGYTWAVHLFSWSGLSLDFRDKFGWTALHWAAYSGREKMVAALLSAGARPYYVTDPTSENPAGCTAADLAFKKGYDGLAAYLSEKALVEHFKDMGINQNESGSLQSTNTKTEKRNPENLNEGDLCLKDTLTAYRTAADAAARIQAAFREHSFKLRAKEVEASKPEIEARNIIAAMKIQHAFRGYDSRKKMAAALRIQDRFRTWKMRRQFLNIRRQAVKIQAAFRGFQVRRHYTKIVWSVGVLEKAILRWRLKRKGLRGRKVDPTKGAAVQGQESITEEDFFRTGRKQAEERVETAVVRVQALFRSKKAQEEYRRMKLAHDEAKLTYEGLLNPDVDMAT